METDMLHLIAFGLLAILGRGIFVFLAPVRKCRWCRPGGLIGGSIVAWLAGHEPPPRRRRRRGCWRCGGHQLTRRWGAYHMHKVKLSLIQAWEEREWWR
jgi:hypothetical protein